MARVSRRRFLQLGGAAAIGIGAAPWLGCARWRGEAGVERPIELIDHVVVIYQENWSFDSLFGTFPGANGLASGLDTVRQVDRDGQLYPTLPPSLDNRRSPAAPDARIPTGQAVAPFDLGAYVKPSELAGNPLHRYYQHIHQIDGGKLDKFVAWGNTGGLVMSYYDGTTLPLGRLARDYVLCDNFFQAALGGSFLNHAWLICAATPRWPDAPAAMRAQLQGDTLIKDGELSPEGDIVNTAYTINAPHPASIPRERLAPSLTLPTIGDRLSERGVSWRWYSGGWDAALAGRAHPNFQFHHQPFAYFANYADGTAAKAEHLRDEEEIWRDIATGALPAVTFVKPNGPLNEHPGYADLLSGQQHVERLIGALMASPAWRRTAIIVTYDEYGGRWDHVPPPIVDPWGPGTRVPAVIASPYARRRTVDHTVYDTTSILKFIETRWKLAPLSTRDAAANDLTAAFDFTQTPSA
ncbi:MAG TPA: alkaline phosphatase family protein [Methylomirabilota bacterium]|nr:alkaline phosphatase family protein [Methylomirabilota bacterium]